MNNLNQNVKKLWKVIAGGGTLLAYQSWFDNQKGKALAAEQAKILSEMRQSLEGVKTDINNVVDENVRNNLLSKNSKISEEIQNMNLAHKKFQEHIHNVKQGNFNVDDAEALKSSFDHYNKEMLGLFNNLNQRVEDLNNAIKPTKFLGDNSIYELIDQYKEYLSTLSTYELCILMDILMISFIFACLTTILFSFYGNYFIEKLSLETKFPKLSKFIQIRVKLQHFYIITNFIYIFLALIFLAYVNIATLYLN